MKWTCCFSFLLSLAVALPAAATTVVFDFEDLTGFSGDVVQTVSGLTVFETPNGFDGNSQLNSATDAGNGFIFTGPPEANTTGSLFVSNAGNQGAAIDFVLDSFDFANDFAGTDPVTITGLLDGVQQWSFTTTASVDPLTYLTSTAGAGFTIDQIDITNGGTTNNVNRFDNLQVTAIPEPAACLLFAAGGLAIVARRRR